MRRECEVDKNLKKIGVEEIAWLVWKTTRTFERARKRKESVRWNSIFTAAKRNEEIKRSGWGCLSQIIIEIW